MGCWYECIAVDREVDKQAAIRLSRRLKELHGYLRSLKPHRILVLGLIPEFQIVRFAYATRFGSNATPPHFIEGKGWNPVEGRRFIPVGNVPHYCEDMIRFPTSHFVVHGYIKIDSVLTTQYATEHGDLELKYLPDAYPLNNTTGNPYFPGHYGMRDITSPQWSLSYLKDLSRAWSEAMYTGKGYDEGLKDWKRALHMLTRHYRRYSGNAATLRRPDDLLESERVTLSIAGEAIPSDRRQKVGARKKVQELNQEKRRIAAVEEKEAEGKRNVAVAPKAPNEVKLPAFVVSEKQKQPIVVGGAQPPPNTRPASGVATKVEFQLPAKSIRKPGTKRAAVPLKTPSDLVKQKKLQLKTKKLVTPAVVVPVATSAVPPPPPDEPLQATEEEEKLANEDDEVDITFGYMAPSSDLEDDGW